MEPNNLENLIKEKLNSREIQPSSQAWDRLDAMLSSTETKKKKSYFNWWAIAASFVGFVAVGTYFYNQNTIEINSNPVVTIENKIQKEELDVENKTIPQDIINSEKSLKQNAKGIVQVEKNGHVNRNNNRSNDNASSNVAHQIKINEEKMASVILSTDKSEQITSQVRPNSLEIDELLASVEKSPNSKTANLKINSMALLNEVNSELEMTFREKALIEITKKYKAAKIALTNRNNQ